MALQAHPNPQLLEACLRFLGTSIPPEFASIWNARILEMADLDRNTSAKVDAYLKSRNLPTLVERAMHKN